MEHCRKGHERTEENTRYALRKDGTTYRKCRVCDRETNRKSGKKHNWYAKPKPKKIKLSDKEYIQSKIVINDNDCWIWQGYTRKDGYGSLTRDGKAWLVHRYVFQTYNYTLGLKAVLDHLCGIKLCCNPDHLEDVIQRENAKRSMAVESLKHRVQNASDFLQTLGYSEDEIQRILSHGKTEE